MLPFFAQTMAESFSNLILVPRKKIIFSTYAYDFRASLRLRGPSIDLERLKSCTSRSLHIKFGLLGSLEPFKNFVVSGLVVGWEVVDGVHSHFSDHP